MGLRGRIAVTITLAGLCAGALVFDRSLQFFIGRDSSVFLYVARRVQAGELPYRDVWDHKPPLIYYLDVIGLALNDRGIPGVPLIEFVALFFAAIVAFWALNRTLGVLPALLGSIAWLTALPLILDGGNLPEEYAIPLQLSAIALFVWERRAGPSRWRWLAFGAAGGFALLLKPTVLGVWAAIYVAESVRAWRRRSLPSIVGPALLGAFGALAVVTPVAAYFAATGAGNDLVDQVIRYNIFYSQSTLSDRLGAFAEGVKLTSFSGLFPIALVGWLFGLAHVVRGSAPLSVRPLFLVGVLALPIDLALASATGRPYRQYFLACLPTLGVLAAIAAYCVGPMLERAATRMTLPSRAVVLGTFALCVVVFASAIPTLAQYRRDDGPNAQQRTRPEATAYVVDHTASTDRVLFWGGEAGLNYTTGRRSPTRYAYQYALYMRGYQRPEFVGELLLSLQREPPALIVDASPATTDVPPLDGAARQRWTPMEPHTVVLPEMDALFRWIDDHYARIGEVGYLGWPIYAPRNGVRAALRQNVG
jgi:hypothetical protein